jgi:hypothetical protein
MGLVLLVILVCLCFTYLRRFSFILLGTIKEFLIPQILTEMADIVLEIDQASRFGLPLSKPLRSLRNWEQIDIEKYKIDKTD